jgi:hypothetical protein
MEHEKQFTAVFKLTKTFNHVYEKDSRYTIKAQWWYCVEYGFLYHTCVYYKDQNEWKSWFGILPHEETSVAENIALSVFHLVAGFNSDCWEDIHSEDDYFDGELYEGKS